MKPKRYSKFLSLDYMIERLQARKGKTADDILGNFFKLTHRLEKAIEAVEAELAELEKLDPQKATHLHNAWGDGSRLKEFVQHLGQAAMFLRDRR